MKILFPIGAFYPSQQGGPCNTLYWHTLTLKKHEISPIIITTSSGITRNQLKWDTFLNKEYGKVYYGLGKYHRFRTILTALRQVKDVDIIHLNSMFNPLSIATFFYAKMFFNQKPIIWSVRGELNKRALGFSKLKKKPILFLYRNFTQKIVFHATVPKEVDEIHNIFPDNKILEIPNYIILPKRIKIEKTKTLLFIGRLHPIKAIDKIIHALNLSSEFRDSEYQFIIAGKNEKRHKNYLHKLKNLVKQYNFGNKIKFVGHITGSAKEQLFAQSYFTFLMSETENFGNVVIESLNQGTPVVASSTTPWESLRKNKCGYHILNEPQNIAKYIDKIIKLKNTNYSVLKNNAYKLVDQEFDIKNGIHKWINIYKNTLEESQRKKKTD